MANRYLCFGLAALLSVPGFQALAADHHKSHGPAMKPMKMAASGSCTAQVRFTDAAEGKPGGANYSGPPVAHHGKHAMDMPQMKGAHMDHKARHGGAFFMAPDKMHHLEGIYSERCGFRLFFYNAFTEPVRASRFRAFVRVIPDADDQAETQRFLTPAKDGSVLRANLGSDFSRPFTIEAMVKFPGADAPELFTFKIPAKAPLPAGAIAVRIQNGQVVGKQTVKVKKGDKVHLQWMTDEMVSIHLHGYDIKKMLRPGPGGTQMRFEARATGRFPITSHGFGEAALGEEKKHAHGGHKEKTLLYLEVHPR